jgi:hypothetical protein
VEARGSPLTRTLTTATAGWAGNAVPWGTAALPLTESGEDSGDGDGGCGGAAAPTPTGTLVELDGAPAGAAPEGELSSQRLTALNDAMGRGPPGTSGPLSSTVRLGVDTPSRNILVAMEHSTGQTQEEENSGTRSFLSPGQSFSQHVSGRLLNHVDATTATATQKGKKDKTRGTYVGLVRSFIAVASTTSADRPQATIASTKATGWMTPSP